MIINKIYNLKIQDFLCLNICQKYNKNKILMMKMHKIYHYWIILILWKNQHKNKMNYHKKNLMKIIK